LLQWGIEGSWGGHERCGGGWRRAGRGVGKLGCLADSELLVWQFAGQRVLQVLRCCVLCGGMLRAGSGCLRWVVGWVVALVWWGAYVVCR
jgi:hypothetical protein